MCWPSEECERRADLHFNAELSAVEVLAEPGRTGRVIVTDLRGRTAPLLRWDTGDLAAAPRGPFPCGRALPTIGVVEGRASRTVAVDGRSVTTRGVLDALADVLSIDDYVVQRENEGILLRLAPGVAAAAREAGLLRLRALFSGLEVTPSVGLPPGLPDKTHPLGA